MSNFKKFAAASALLAAVSLGATPAAAADLPVSTARSAVAVDLGWDVGDEVYERHRRWGHRRWHHRNRIDGGDVLAGILVIGGIAAIASAASKNNRERRYRDRDYRYRDGDYRYRERRGDSRYSGGGSGIDRAVSMCLSEIERDVRVDSVDNVSRTGSGWVVSGALYNGEPFTCRIDSNGRIDAIDFGVRGAAYQQHDDRQHSDERYRSAWADVDGRAVPSAAAQSEQVPAYPGGPVDGDLTEDQMGTGYQGAGN